MTDTKELPSITISKRKIHPDGVIAEEVYVQVKNNDINKCHNLAKKILKEDLK